MVAWPRLWQQRNICGWGWRQAWWQKEHLEDSAVVFHFLRLITNKPYFQLVA